MINLERDEIKILSEISRKMDQLIILLKLSNRKSLDEFKKDVKKDKVSKKILELADGTLSYSDLSNKIAEETEVAEITVKRKISSLREMGFLITRKEGREVYYENSGLFE